MKTRIFFAAAALFAVTAAWSAAPVFAQIGGGDDDGGGSGGGSGGDDGGGSGGSGGGSGIGSGSGGGSGSGSGSGSDSGIGTDGGFSRESRDPSDFVGADSEDNLSVRGGEAGAGGAGSDQGLGGFFNQLFGGGAGGAGQQRQRNQPSGGVRVRLTPSIEYFGAGEANPHAVRMAARQAAILPRYSQNPHVGSIAGVQMVVADRVAVLTGTVATERQKELVAGMLMLEPGISSVDNQLIVAPTNPLDASVRDSSSMRAFSAATD
jgi:hypothetical protein